MPLGRPLSGLCKQLYGCCNAIALSNTLLPALAHAADASSPEARCRKTKPHALEVRRPPGCCTTL